MNDKSKLIESASVLADVLEEAAQLVRRSAVLEPGEWAIQHCAFGFVLVGKWYDLGGGWIGCKPGEAWTYTRQRGGQGIGYLAEHGPTEECRLDFEPAGVEIQIGPGLPRRRCNAAAWDTWAARQ